MCQQHLGEVRVDAGVEREVVAGLDEVDRSFLNVVSWGTLDFQRGESVDREVDGQGRREEIVTLQLGVVAVLLEDVLYVGQVI